MEFGRLKNIVIAFKNKNGKFAVLSNDQIQDDTTHFTWYLMPPIPIFSWELTHECANGCDVEKLGLHIYFKKPPQRM